MVGRWRDPVNTDSGTLAANNLITPTNSTTLVVKPDVFVPGQFYSLSYDIASTQSSAVVASNRFFFLVNTSPRFGNISTSTALDAARRFDRITITADGWVDEEQPLKYLFSIATPSLEDEIFLSEPTDSPSIQAVMPLSGPMTIRLRVSDADGAQTTFDLTGTVSTNITGAPLLESFLKYSKWGDFRTASQYAVAVALSEITDAAALSVVDLMLNPIYNLTQRRQVGPSYIPNLLTIVSSICRIPEAVSSRAVDQATAILDYVVDLAESDPTVTIFSASSSRLSQLISSSFLRAGSQVARSLSLNPSSSNSTKTQLLDILSRLISLQSRFSSDLETSTSVSSQFLNVTSQLLTAAASSISYSTTVSGSAVTIGISGIVSGNISLQTISWNPATFPFGAGANFSSQSIITALVSGGQITDVTAILYADGSTNAGNRTCARFDESANSWTSDGCTLTDQGGKYPCTCTISNPGPSGRVSLALIYGSVSDIDGNPPGSASPRDPNAPPQVNSGVSGGGLSVGGIIAIVAVVAVILAAVAVGAVIYFKKKNSTRVKKAEMMARITFANNAGASPAASQSPTPAAPASRRQASWSVAQPQANSLTNEIEENDLS
eukprot:TRINITY_DN2998_c1_g1_i1.p1 TRINITY_DN2998_c1_g1~~TRINITY_DN2998_c1_g1_i1.p1  ORF type:complete len:609 (+),score=98.84 TRINITY_DN2998_c1_g1_i1:500-2326(+)